MNISRIIALAKTNLNAADAAIIIEGKPLFQARRTLASVGFHPSEYYLSCGTEVWNRKNPDGSEVDVFVEDGHTEHSKNCQLLGKREFQLEI